jgi:uncharacterized membrane protein YtjA (UPF0391 family)
MLRLASIFVLVGVGSEIYGLMNQAAPGSPVAQLLGFVALTLSMILLILGLPAIRNLVG